MALATLLGTFTLPTEIFAQDAVATSSSGLSGSALITQKLDSCMVDKIDFDKADISTVVAFLQKKSKELDPAKQGINFVLALAPASNHKTAPHREVSLKLENVSLGNILKEICNQTKLDYRVEDYAVFLRPAGDTSETLTVRTFAVPSGFFANTPASDHTTDVKQALISRGVQFPDGASATFVSTSAKLVVRNTAKQLDLIATLLDGGNATSTGK